MVSADNLNGSDIDSTDFKQAVHDQLQHYLLAGFPPRAQQFMLVLANFYQVQWPLNAAQFRSVGLVNN
jgi:elongation factor P hydroxylase